MERNETVEQEEEFYLKVAGGSKVKSVGSAIAREVLKRKQVAVRAIGVQAVNQTVKAIAIANGFVGQKGKVLWCRPGFDDVTVPDKMEEITAIRFIVKVE